MMWEFSRELRIRREGSEYMRKPKTSRLPESHHREIKGKRRIVTCKMNENGEYIPHQCHISLTGSTLNSIRKRVLCICSGICDDHASGCDKNSPASSTWTTDGEQIKKQRKVISTGIQNTGKEDKTKPADLCAWYIKIKGRNLKWEEPRGEARNWIKCEWTIPRQPRALVRRSDMQTTRQPWDNLII